jgi:hypothetical protein
MEICKSEEKFLIFFWLCAALIIFWSDFIEGTFKVSLETLWRLICDFDTALKYRNREVLARH